MSKSIETIWKEGLINSDDLVVPKINDLYQKKSIHIIDKFRRMFRINLLAIRIGAFVPLILFIAQGIPLTGVIIFLLLLILDYYGRKELVLLDKIDKNESCYLYLKEFDRWMKGQIAHYTKIYTFFYPMFFLSFPIGFWFSDRRESMLQQLTLIFSDSNLVYGIPLLAIVTVVILTAIITIFAGALYRFDLSLVYGKIMRKWDELIADIDELRG